MCLGDFYRLNMAIPRRRLSVVVIDDVEKCRNLHQDLVGRDCENSEASVKYVPGGEISVP